MTPLETIGSAWRSRMQSCTKFHFFTTKRDTLGLRMEGMPDAAGVMLQHECRLRAAAKTHFQGILSAWMQTALWSWNQWLYLDDTLQVGEACQVSVLHDSRLQPIKRRQQAH